MLRQPQLCRGLRTMRTHPLAELQCRMGLGRMGLGRMGLERRLVRIAGPAGTETVWTGRFPLRPAQPAARVFSCLRPISATGTQLAGTNKGHQMAIGGSGF